MCVLCVCVRMFTCVRAQFCTCADDRECVCVHVSVPMCTHAPVTVLGQGELDTGTLPPLVFSLFAEEEFLTKPRASQFTSLPWESQVGTS